jgi:hypothetical protein
MVGEECIESIQSNSTTNSASHADPDSRYRRDSLAICTRQSYRLSFKDLLVLFQTKYVD